MDHWLLAGLLWLALIVVLSIRTQRALDRLQKVHESRHVSSQLGRELAFSSDELTRLARLHAVTGKAAYEEEFRQVLEARNGERARKDGRTIALRALMEQAGFTQREFSLLKEAEDLSNVLVRTEEVAMHAAKGHFDDGSGRFTRRGPPDLGMATRLMHSDEYQHAKALILAKIDEFEHEIGERTMAAIATHTRSYERYALATMLAVPAMVLVALISCLFLKRQFSRPLLPVVDALRAGGSALAATAERILVTSELMNDGARTQAASVTQTSASLDALAAGAHQNAAQARRAKNSAADARADAEAGVQEMAAMRAVLTELQEVGSHLGQSMAEIRRSSSEVFQIAQTVDELAFRTNLLSLNAAIEAAHAGHSGRGFAVVAAEVRNLSRSSAEAARETAGLIEKALATSEEGTGIVRQVVASLDKLTASTGRVDHRLQNIRRSVAEVDGCMNLVTTSCEQQSRSIGEIGLAVGEVDRVIQDSVSRAGDCTRAAGTLLTQAQRLTRAVTKIEDLVGSSPARANAAAPPGRPLVRLLRPAASSVSPVPGSLAALER